MGNVTKKKKINHLRSHFHLHHRLIRTLYQSVFQHLSDPWRGYKGWLERGQQSTEHTIWFAKRARVSGRVLFGIVKFLILSIARSTWILTDAICHVC